MKLDLTKPKGETKICHHCATPVTIFGYVHQDCENCGKEFMPVNRDGITQPYIAPTGLNVLSLFDGLSGGRIALERAGVPVKHYFASEIDPYAMQISKKNWDKKVVQVGNVEFLSKNMFANCPIDLLIGGSPCQSFSKAGDGTGFDGSSKLFWEYVRLLKELKPKYFLLENVSMKQEWKDVISEAVGCQPIVINSKVASAQSRKRLYWTNIPQELKQSGKDIVPFDMPDKEIVLSDILEPHDQVEEKFWLSDKAINYMNGIRDKKRNKSRWEHHTNPLDGKASCLTANMYKGVPYGVIKFDRCVQVGNLEMKGNDSIKRVYSDQGKSPTVSACVGGNHQPKVLDIENEVARKLTPLECERLQTLEDNYTEGVSNTQRYKMIGNGWTIDVVAHLFKGLKAIDELEIQSSEDQGKLDCPYDVDINGEYGTCHCNHENIEDCAGDI